MFSRLRVPMTGAVLLFLKLEPSGFLGKLTEVFQRIKDEKLWGRFKSRKLLGRRKWWQH